MMATAAVRTPKRELEPHWRDALRASLKRLALRTWGAMLFGLAVATAVALATHSTTDPSFSTAAGGPPSNWIGSFGAYASDALLLLFGMGSVLFLPVVALAGLRMMRLEPTGRVGRALLVAATGAILIGIALSLTSADARTMPLLVAAQDATRGPQWWAMSVLVLIMIVPVIVMAIVLERFISRGILIGAVKG